MGRKALNLTGVDGYFAFRFGLVTCRPDERTGRLPLPLPCSRWHVRPVDAVPWTRQAEHFIETMEQCQETGDLDRISRNLPAIEHTADRLEAEAESLRKLAQRARTIRESHEPSAGER